MDATYRYLIIGAGLAGVSAVAGIRELDSDGRILLIGDEAELPYDRPPLSKKLWLGKKKLEEIFLHDRAWYETHGVELAPGTEAIRLDPGAKVAIDRKGTGYGYEKLLLATGGRPRRLTVPGGELEGVCYYRYLADYRRTRAKVSAGASVVVIGGGFIGSELAAALRANEVSVTMVYPEDSLCARVFPSELGQALQEQYRSRGITVHAGENVAGIAREGGRFVTTTEAHRLESDLVIAGIGIRPAMELAQQAGLRVDNGIVVDECLRTSDPAIHAAGDTAFFPYQALEERRRVEHWDNAGEQGKCAGRNLAGAGVRYDHMPYFFSDLFEFGYEAVGDVDSRLEVVTDWQQEFEKGVIYYPAEGKVRGVMLCNLWDKVEAARALIRRGERMTREDLRGAIQ
jgi:NADPH-dependent 2,4-dienoyl-CoA reductase/sulfur reductase-like enzyme